MIWGILLDLSAAALFAAAAIFVLVRPPPPPLRGVLFWVQIGALFWIVGDLGTLLARTEAWEQTSIAVLYAGSLALAPLWWLLALRFSERHGVTYAWMTPKIRWAPLWVAFGVWLLVLTNPWHGQFLTPVIGARNEYHWMWWMAVPLLYLGACGILALFVVTFRRLPRHGDGRRQCMLMILATASCLLANAAYTLAPIDWPFDVTVFGGLLTGMLFLGGVYSRTVVDIPPHALREVLRNDPTGLVVVQRGRLTYANPRAKALLGDAPLPLEFPAWESLAERLRSDEGAPVRAPQLEDALREPGHRGALYRLGDDEPARWLWLTGLPLPARRDGRGDMVVRIRDASPLQALVEDQRSLAEQLRSAEATTATGVLAAGIAHEINNPLGAILISAQLAEDSRQDEPDAEGRAALARAALSDAVEETARARAIIESMQRFASPIPGSLVDRDINEPILRARELVQKAAERQRARISLELGEALPPVRMNPTQIEQVFVNLIHNAIQSGGFGRAVVVRSERAGGGVRATVRDDGPGMSPEQVTRAFVPFQTWRRERGGTGLGLSVVHGIVEAHGGHVRIESELGLGTRVVIDLPPVETAGA